jgi:small subunit ribosomal protein S20
LYLLKGDGKPLANTKSAQKRIRSNERKRVVNRLVLASTRTYTKKARTLLTVKTIAQAEPALKDAVSALDRAVSKGVIHKNAAARRKSRMMKRYNNLTAPAKST